MNKVTQRHRIHTTLIAHIHTHTHTHADTYTHMHTSTCTDTTHTHRQTCSPLLTHTLSHRQTRFMQAHRSKPMQFALHQSQRIQQTCSRKLTLNTMDNLTNVANLLWENHLQQSKLVNLFCEENNQPPNTTPNMITLWSRITPALTNLPLAQITTSRVISIRVSCVHSTGNSDSLWCHLEFGLY